MPNQSESMLFPVNPDQSQNILQNLLKALQIPGMSNGNLGGQQPQGQQPQAQSPLVQGSLQHPEVQQAMADETLKQARNMVKQAWKPANQQGGASGSWSDSGQPTQPQPTPQQPSMQQPQGLPQSPDQGQGNLLQQLMQLSQGQNQRQPGFLDYMAAAGGVPTPTYTGAQESARTNAHVGPEVLRSYMTGQLPLTTEQSATLGMNQYKAQQEVMNQSLEREKGFQQSVQDQIDTEAKSFRGPIGKLFGFSTPKIQALQNQLLESKIRQVQIQHEMDMKIKKVSEYGRAESQSQNQYRTTASGNKFKAV